MGRKDGPNSAVEFCNDDGCPYVNQTIREAVHDYSRVLAAIELRSLPGDLQVELGLLRRQYSDTPLGAPAR
jgi:hypothetical protein